MTATSAIGLCILSALAAALPVWVACARYYAPRRLKEHLAWVKGYDMCSRIRDREESQARKERLLSVASSNNCDNTSRVEAVEFRGVGESPQKVVGPIYIDLSQFK